MTASTRCPLSQGRTAYRRQQGKRRRPRVSAVTGLVPAIAYGPGFPSTPIAVPPKEVAAILKSELGKNTVITLAVEGKTLLAMIRDFALHPVQRYLEHVDFVEVKLDRPVEVKVPLIAVGKAVGVTKGGVLRIVHRLVPIRCLPDRIPVKIETDVTNLELRRRTHRDARSQAAGRGHRPDARNADARLRRRAGEGSRRDAGRGCSACGGCSGADGRLRGSCRRREEGRQEGREEGVVAKK